MYSNNILNFQETTTILNAHTKKVWKLTYAPRLLETVDVTVISALSELADQCIKIIVKLIDYIILRISIVQKVVVLLYER